MNPHSQPSQRFILTILLLVVLIIAMFAPGIIDLYTGAPQAQGSEANEVITPILPSPESTLQVSEEGLSLLNGPTASPRPPSPRNCTFPLEFWRTHHDSWPSQGMTFGSLVLDQETALAVINSTANDVQIVVLRELIVYSLNSLHGADPSAVAEAVEELRDWLTRNGSAGPVPEPDRQRGFILAGELEAFNRGLSGPEPCPETTDTPTPTVTSTLSPTPSPTPSLTYTIPPPTRQPPLPNPTATSKPNPPPKPTAAPTQPPPPPTAAPTQPPPPTVAPTQPPPPTSVPTSVPTPTSPP